MNRSVLQKGMREKRIGDFLVVAVAPTAATTSSTAMEAVKAAAQLHQVHTCQTCESQSSACSGGSSATYKMTHPYVQFSYADCFAFLPVALPELSWAVLC